MNSTVKYARLHNSIFIPGLGDYGPPLSNDLTAKSRDLKMTLKDGFLELVTKGHTVLVPLTMVTHMILAESNETNSKNSNA